MIIITYTNSNKAYNDMLTNLKIISQKLLALHDCLPITWKKHPRIRDDKINTINHL
ncbi:MAG: hypothetical protein IKW58_01085 [Alphaproteobacteria bacterium]|nr:hypothetical protein [Alphaproteobacteria bacterium]